MTNHIHLVAIPVNEESLAKALGRAHFKYTQFINRFHGRSGHLWQNRFFSCPLDGDGYLAAMQYVELNPSRAKLVKEAWQWPWSSAAAHTDTGKDETGLLELDKWRSIMNCEKWRNELAGAQNGITVELLRLRTRTGRPLGSDSFVSRMEAIIGRRLRALPVGRPKKEKKA